MAIFLCLPAVASRSAWHILIAREILLKWLIQDSARGGGGVISVYVCERDWCEGSNTNRLPPDLHKSTVAQIQLSTRPTISTLCSFAASFLGISPSSCSSVRDSIRGAPHQQPLRDFLVGGYVVDLWTILLFHNSTRRMYFHLLFHATLLDFVHFHSMWVLFLFFGDHFDEFGFCKLISLEISIIKFPF